MSVYVFTFRTITRSGVRSTERPVTGTDLLARFDQASAWMQAHPNRTVDVYGPGVQRSICLPETLRYIVDEVIGKQPVAEPAPATTDAQPRLEQETEAVEEVALIVRHRTSGGRSIPHTLGEGELVEVIIDGHRRPAKAGDVNVAYRWLQERGFEPVGFRWIDRAGLIRRRQQIYRKATQ